MASLHSGSDGLQKLIGKAWGISGQGRARGTGHPIHLLGVRLQVEFAARWSSLCICVVTGHTVRRSEYSQDIHANDSEY